MGYTHTHIIIFFFLLLLPPTTKKEEENNENSVGRGWQHLKEVRVI
jgi:hypothetical protein